MIWRARSVRGWGDTEHRKVRRSCLGRPGLSILVALIALAAIGAPGWVNAEQVILTTREQQSLKALMGRSGEIEQLIMKEVGTFPLSTANHFRMMADISTHTLLCSFNGGAYASCAGGGTSVTGTGVAGRVPFWTSATNLSNDATFLWNNTTKTFTVGTGDQFAIFDTLQTASQKSAVALGTSGTPSTTRGGIFQVFKTTSLTTVDASCANASDPECGAAVQIEHRALGATQAVQITGLNVSASSASTVASPGGDVVAGFFRGLKTAGTGLANGVHAQGMQRSVTGFVTGAEISGTWDQGVNCPYSIATFPQCIGAHVVANANGHGTLQGVGIFVNSAAVGVEMFQSGIWFNAGSVGGANSVTIDDATASVVGFRLRGAKTTGIDLSGGTYVTRAIVLPSGTVNDSKIEWTSGFFIEGNTPAIVPGTTNTGRLGSTTVFFNDVFSTNHTGTFLRLRETGGGTDNVGFTAPASVATTTIWTLPSAEGLSGQALTTNGAGVLSWANAISGLTTGRVPYAASATTLADSANLAWNNGTAKLTVTGSLTVATGGIDVATGFTAATLAGVTTTYVVRCEAATDKLRTITVTGGIITSTGTCA